MRLLLQTEANRLLRAHGLKIGNWNELADVEPSAVLRKAYAPPKNGLELYVASQKLLDWIAGGWAFLQIDNSTAPLDDEARIFERLMSFGETRWNIAEQKSFLIDDGSEARSDANQTLLVLVVYFSLLFNWHVYLVSEHASSGQRLALQDGWVYFFGDKDAIDSADELVNCLAENPLKIE